MKFTDFEFDVGEEFNDKFNAKVFSKQSKKTHNVSIELTEDGLRIKSFTCNCKSATINKSMNKPLAECRHVKQLKKIIIEMGYLQ